MYSTCDRWTFFWNKQWLFCRACVTEAAEGGPIAIVEDGDEIYINVDQGILSLKVEEEEIQRRLRAWKRPEKEIPRGYLRLYSKVAASANKGAVH